MLDQAELHDLMFETECKFLLPPAFKQSESCEVSKQRELNLIHWHLAQH